MKTVASARAAEGTLADEPRWLLVQRVARSATFEKSRRLRDFLIYVGERALREPGRPLTEDEIRREVFGRTTDGIDDTLVRVQASHLRRRLEQYFAVEGAGEPVVIEVPRGAYTPVFLERMVGRPAAAMAPPQTLPVPDAARTRLASWPKVVAVLAGLLAIASVLLAVDARRRAAALQPAALLGPSVDRLWREMFGSGSVYVVLSDTNLSLFQDSIKYQLSLTEYQRQRFVALAEARVPAAEVPVSWRLMNRENTSIADATLATRVTRVNALQGRKADVVLARRADPGQFQGHHAILSGPRRSNPWVELFEGRLNFRSRFEERVRRASLVNTAPQPGEAAEYVVEWNKVGYGRVAYLPSLQGGAAVLLLSGIDLSSTDACSDFVTNEARLRELFRRLGVAGSERIPYFEVLLRTDLLLGSSSRYELVAVRVHGRR